MKKITTIKTISAKRNPKYEIRKEHVAYTDGTTEDRIMCYSLEGKPLGGIQETERKLKSQAIVPAPVVKKSTKK
jgi:hypothetical protein